MIVDLDDKFSRPMAQMAASTSMFRRELDRSGRDVDVFDKRTQSAEKSIDKFSGRLGLLANVAASLGPALIPVAALGIPAVAGLAAQFGFAALAGGTAIAAFQGVGDALEAMNKAQLEPTAENLEAAKVAMEAISPAAQDFVRQLRSMGPEMKALRDIAAEGMFPGVVEGLESMESLLPKVERILGAVSGELGSIASDTGASFASERWSDFFDFLATDAPSALRDMATAVGNVTHAAAEMWMAFDPLNDDFSAWLVDSTAKLDEWASGLDQTQGFQEFVDYIRTTGPQVGETLGAIADALLQIVEAAAPIAGPILAGIEAFAKAVAAIADSDLGTPIFGMVAALSALNLALRVTSTLSKTALGQGFTTGKAGGLAGSLGAMIGPSERARTSIKGLRSDLAVLGPAYKDAGTRAERLAVANESLRKNMGGVGREVGKAGAVVAGMAVLTTGLGDKMGVTNTASLALMGTMAGPWGAAIGGAVGATIDLAHANDDLRAATTAAKASMDTGEVDAMTAAYDKLGAKIRETKEVPSHFAVTPGAILDRFKGMAGAVTGALGKGQDELAGLGGALAGAGAANFASSLLKSQGLMAGNAAAVETFGKALRGLDNDMLSTAESAGAMATALGALVGPGLSAEAATDQYRVALQGLSEELKDVKGGGDPFEGFGKNAVANREATRGFMTDLTAMVTAQAEAGVGAGKIARTVKEARDAFIAEGVAAGFTAGEMRKRANAIGLTPKLVRTVMEVVNADAVDNISKRLQSIPRTKLTKILAEGIPKSEAGMRELQKRYNLTPRQVRTLAMLRDQASPIQKRILAALKRLDGQTAKPKANLQDNASAKIQSISQKLGALNGKTAFTTAWTIYKTMGPKSARGNIFGAGDVANRHMPELAGPGPARVWREPETQGEAYIPLANDDRRPRARAIAAETVSLLGGDVEWFAGGGRKGGGGGGNTAGLRAELARLRVAIAGNTKAVSAATARREALAAKRSELASTVKGKFTSELFGESNVWASGGGAGGAFGILKADIAKAKTFKSLLYGLSKRGLDGDALAELASTGDVGKAQAFASMSTKDLGTYESLYRQRASVASAVGSYAGMAAFSAEQAAATKVLQASLAVQKQQSTRLAQLEKALRGTGREVAKGVNSATGPARRHRKGKVG